MTCISADNTSLNQCSDYSLCFLQGSISMQQLKLVNCILFSVPLIYLHMRQLKVSHQMFDLLYFLMIPAIFASYIFQFCISIQLQRCEFFLSFCSLFSLPWKKNFFLWCQFWPIFLSWSIFLHLIIYSFSLSIFTFFAAFL